MLINGIWQQDWQPVQAKDEKGGFVRQTSSFRNWVTSDGSSNFPAEAGRYHLYVALICPWASRTLIARKLKGLDSAVAISIVEPELTAQGWRFGTYPGATNDPINHATYMHDLDTAADPAFTGRATVPALWDTKTRTIVSNESADIVRMFNAGFGTLASGPDLYPADLAPEIDALNDIIYPGLNNGVYRAGFATTQVAYDEAFATVFATLDRLEQRLSDARPYLHGTRFTETDIRAFVTLVRFDAAYHGIFKCNLRRLTDYPHLQAYMERILTLPGIAETVNIDHIKRGAGGGDASWAVGFVDASDREPLAGRAAAVKGLRAVGGQEGCARQGLGEMV